MSRHLVAALAEDVDNPTWRPDRRPHRTIRKILDAGLVELRSSSYADLSMRAVAGRAGVSAASAYRYFPSKDVLVAQIYFELFEETPLHVDVNETAVQRVTAALHDMALVGADEPELTAACATALMADDPAMLGIRLKIGTEVSRRIDAALGPGWPDAVRSTLQMTYAGALMSTRFLPHQRVAEYLDTSVELILASGSDNGR